LGVGITLPGCFFPPLHRLAGVAGKTSIAVEATSQLILGLSESLVCGAAKPTDRLPKVLGQTASELKTNSQVELRFGDAVFRGAADAFDGIGFRVS
jgi:hypothetical protein